MTQLSLSAAVADGPKYVVPENGEVEQPTSGYCVDRDLVELEDRERACHAVLEVVLPRVEKVWIDAYSDERELPPEVAAAQEALFQMGRSRTKGDPGMGIDLDAHNAEHVQLLRTFAAWSISVELYAASMRWVAQMSDTGSSVCFNVTGEELAKIQPRLAGLPIAALKRVRRPRKD